MLQQKIQRLKEIPTYVATTAKMQCDPQIAAAVVPVLQEISLVFMVSDEVIGSPA